VGPTDEKIHSQICRAINGPTATGASKELTAAPLDPMLLKAASERANLAGKIVASNEVESRASKSNNWFTKAAEDCDLELDDERVMDRGQGGGDQKARQRLSEAKRARGMLNELLKKPMRKQHFGKFLGSAGAKAAAEHAKNVTPYVVNMDGDKRSRDSPPPNTKGKKGGKSKKKALGEKGGSRKKRRM
jgi:ATP-dependent RNA helicase DDX24/MAK5